MSALRLLPALAFALLAAATAPQSPAQRGGGDKPYEEQPPLPAGLAAPPSPPLTPEEALETFQLEPGFAIELVACEPLVQDPVAIAFDPEGRLWVVEMRGFMPDIDGRGEFEPNGRVSVLEDADGDGRMDRSTVFLDRLVLPRAIALVHGGALVAEHERLWFARDTGWDLVADEKTLVDPRYAVSGSVEHRPNGLLLNIDNTIYNAKASHRYRHEGGRWKRSRTERRGQWGISQDDYGRLYYNFNWSQLHADPAPPGALTRNRHHPSTTAGAAVTADQSVFPLRMNTAVNRGYRPGVLDDRGRLRAFASACAPLIYRGHQFPPGYAGNAFVCAPGANVITRNTITEAGATVAAHRAVPGRDFLASTDERFRPVNLANGPGGALFVVDMYRGVIQQADFMTSYLRRESLRRGLDKPVNLGRIYRVVHTGRPRPRPPEDLGRATPAGLVGHLSHPDGWVRDTAQRLLVEGGKLPAGDLLQEAAAGAEDPRARAHALWALEGLGAAGPEIIGAALRDPHPKLRATALRLAGDLARRLPARREALAGALAALPDDGEPAVDLGYILTAPDVLGEDGDRALAERFLPHREDPLFRDALISSLAGVEDRFLAHLWGAGGPWENRTGGTELVLEGLAAAVARSGRPNAIGRVLGLLAKAPPPGSATAWRTRSLLAGLDLGLDGAGFGRGGKKPVTLGSAPAVFDPGHPLSGESACAPLLQRLQTRLAWPGHSPPAPSRAGGGDAQLTVSERRRATLGRGLYATYCASCHGADGAGLQHLAPPLRGSGWVTGPSTRLTRIILQGMEGPVEVGGKTYGPPDSLPAMPPLATLNDSKIAAILTYLRSAWPAGEAGWEGPVAVSAREVSRDRALTAGREAPWTADELLRLTALPPPPPNPDDDDDDDDEIERILP